MTTYADVKKQIAQLEKKAADLRKVEVANIREQMAKYELTVDDIGTGKSAKAGKPVTGNGKVKIGRPAKYKDPKTGKTWTGHGKAPGWIAAATKAGRRDDFLIGKGTQAKDAKPVEKLKSIKPATAAKASTIAKKPQLAAQKAPVTKMATAAAKKPPVATKVKPASPAKKTATKAPAKSPSKSKVKPVSKPASKLDGSLKPVKKATASPVAAFTEAKSPV